MVLLYKLVGPGIVFQVLDPGERQARRSRMHRACHSTQARIVQVLRVCVPGPSLCSAGSSTSREGGASSSRHSGASIGPAVAAKKRRIVYIIVTWGQIGCEVRPTTLLWLMRRLSQQLPAHPAEN